jgi:8-hydroxy-5-deazaflavin:NADPH oxidoreductase
MQSIDGREGLIGLTTIGFIGAGHVGSNIAEAAAKAGYEVVLSNSQGPQSLGSLVGKLGGRARAASVAEAASAGDLVVVAVPVGAFAQIPVAPLAGKVVISTSNYNRSREGAIPAIDDGSTTVGGLLQTRLPDSYVVRAFSMISAGDVPADGRPSGAPDRRALALAGDDAQAKSVVAELYENLGFDAVDAGPLGESWRFGRGQPAFVARQNVAQLRANLQRARR